MKTDMHISRITPFVGHHLQQVRVAIVGFPKANPIVTYLAASGVQRWVWFQTEGNHADNFCHLKTQLQEQHGDAFDFDIQQGTFAKLDQTLSEMEIDLLIMLDEGATTLLTLISIETPILYIKTTLPSQAICYFPGDSFTAFNKAIHQQNVSGITSSWGWATTAPLCAGLARAILLRKTEYHRDDLDQLWQNSVRSTTFGSQDTPFSSQWHKLEAIPPSTQPAFYTPQSRRGNLLIAGLGSLGRRTYVRFLPP